MDLWWTAAVEEQAYDRVHRIGQTQDVEVVRYVCENTVEERIVQLQQRKACISAGAVRKLSAAEVRLARMDDLRSLFEVEEG